MARKMTDGERKFWAEYAQVLERRGIVGKNAQWHVRRAQQFVYGLNGIRLRDVELSPPPTWTFLPYCPQYNKTRATTLCNRGDPCVCICFAACG